MIIQSFAPCRLLPAVAILVCWPAIAFAQQPSQSSTPPQHNHEASVDLFPSREASGTAWLPDETPMYGLRRTVGAWDLMLHGAVFGQFLYEPGEHHRTGGFSSRQASSVN